MSTVVKDLGAVSAYAYAVEKGYTGTEAEFAELMASYAEVGQTATDAAESALNSKTAAQTAATTATNKASEATTAAQTATTKAGEASQSASDANTAKEEAATAKTAAETAQGKAEDAQAAAESVAESIPSDYSQLSEDVSDLKEGLSAIDKVFSDNYINKNDLTAVNKYLTTSATNIYNVTTGSSGYRMSNVIETEAQQTWYMNYAAAGSSVMVFYAKADGTIISYATLNKSSTVGNPTAFTTPAGCGLMRIRFIDIQTDVRSNYMIVGTSADSVASYEKYIDTPILLNDTYNYLKVADGVKDKNLRFVVVSDIHFGLDDSSATSAERMSYLIYTFQKINRETPIDFVIVNGDVCQYSASDANYNGVLDYVYKIPFPCFATIGNHDVFASGKWQEMWGLKRSYSMESDDFYFIFCDSYYTNAVDSGGEYSYIGLDAEALEEELKKATSLNKYPVIVTHQYDTSIDTTFNSLCLQYGVKIVVRGHTHIASNTFNSTTGSFILNPGAWLSDSQASTYGLTIVDVEGNHLVSENRQYTYASDTYTSSKANIMEVAKDVAADYQLGRNTGNPQRLINAVG